MNYEILKMSTEKYGERGDCAVKAIAIVLGTSYEDAHTLLKAHGRKDGDGTLFFETTVPALESRGFKLVKRDSINKIGTVKKLECYNIKAKYPNPILILTSGHILALKDNKVEDFTSGRMHRIIGAWEVIPTENAVHSIEIKNFELPKVKAKKVISDKYALVHKDTREVYETFKRFPTKTANNIDMVYIKNQINHTKGKLEIIEL